MDNLLAGIVSFFGFTLNPMKPVENDIRHFKEYQRQQIKSMKSIHRRIGYAVTGDDQKRAVIFIHGSPGSKAAWYSFLLNPELASRFQLIAVDRPGYELSGNRSEPSVKKQAEDITEILKLNRSKQKAILVGHSYGGAVMAKMAMLQPDKFSGLVFVASSVDPRLEETKWYQNLAALPVVENLIPHSLRTCNEEILALKDELQSMLPDWQRISAKVSVIHGDQDDLVPVENIEFMKTKLSLDELRILQGMNHFIPWQRPETIVQAILTLDQR